MARWAQVEAAAAEFAAQVRARFDAHRHKVLATLRADGSPRVSGIEATFAEGDLWLGMMHGSVKARDLQRDPRLALHSGSPDPPEEAGAESSWSGDAKLSGRAEEITDRARVAAVAKAMGAGESVQPMHLFRVEIDDVVLVRVGAPADHLLIEVWRERDGLRRIRRA